MKTETKEPPKSKGCTVVIDVYELMEIISKIEELEARLEKLSSSNVS